MGNKRAPALAAKHAERRVLRSALLGVAGIVVGIAACGVPEASTTSDAGAVPGDDAAVDEQPDSATKTTDAGTDAAPKSCVAGQGLCNGACAAVLSNDDKCGAGSCATACSGGKHCVSGTCQASNIEHVVLIVQENHTFDSYFGMYCQAPAGSNPTCTTGRSCCEGAPIVGGFYTEPMGAHAILLDDDSTNTASNFKSDRAHSQQCELLQIHGGAMDRYVQGTNGGDYCPVGVGPDCSHPNNWVLANGAAPTDTVSYYWSKADAYALADRYFQPIAGGTASNNMYFAGAHHRFVDNVKIPDVAVGTDYQNQRVINPNGLCVDPVGCISSVRATYAMDTIASSLLDAGKSFQVYADGYDEAYNAAAALTPQCASPSAASNCRYNSILFPEAKYGCLYDPSDIPFLYYQRFQDTIVGSTRFPTPYVKDYTHLASDIAGKTLPSFSFIKARLWHNEHPGLSTISDGETFVSATVQMILESPAYQNNTLILLTWDEGGGFFDHVAPPDAPPVGVDADELGNQVPYGTRVPLMAIGAFTKPGTISHVQMEHSSIVKFLEWNFLTRVGKLNARDGWVNNIGSLLDQSKTGIPIPVK